MRSAADHYRDDHRDRDEHGDSAAAPNRDANRSADSHVHTHRGASSPDRFAPVNGNALVNGATLIFDPNNAVLTLDASPTLDPDSPTDNSGLTFVFSFPGTGRTVPDDGVLLQTSQILAISPLAAFPFAPGQPEIQISVSLVVTKPDPLSTTGGVLSDVFSLAVRFIPAGDENGCIPDCSGNQGSCNSNTTCPIMCIPCDWGRRLWLKLSNCVWRARSVWITRGRDQADARREWGIVSRPVAPSRRRRRRGGQARQAGPVSSSPALAAKLTWSRRSATPRSSPHRPSSCMCTDRDLGLGLLQRWRDAEEVVTRPPLLSRQPRGAHSEIRAYRVRQHQHTAEDAFLIVDQLGVDPSRRITVTSAPTGGPSLSIASGAFHVAAARRLQWWRIPTPLTLRSIHRGITFETRQRRTEHDNTPTLFVARDGALNLFHCMADVLNAYLVKRMFPYDRIVFLEGADDGPFMPLWRGLAPVEHFSHLAGSRIIDRAIFAPPGGCSFLWKNAWHPRPQCQKPSPLLRTFWADMLERLGLRKSERPGPVVTLVSRQKRYAGGGAANPSHRQRGSAARHP